LILGFFPQENFTAEVGTLNIHPQTSCNLALKFLGWGREKGVGVYDDDDDVTF
jgi:hypothetical protein